MTAKSSPLQGFGSELTCTAGRQVCIPARYQAGAEIMNLQPLT